MDKQIACTIKYSIKPYILSIANAESRRAFELVTAFQARQITLNELSDAVQPISSEALHVIATFWGSDPTDYEWDPRLTKAQVTLKKLAADARCNC
jgi:hypothetical protein